MENREIRLTKAVYSPGAVGAAVEAFAGMLTVLVWDGPDSIVLRIPETEDSIAVSELLNYALDLSVRDALRAS
jgi:hypothetical protein